MVDTKIPDLRQAYEEGSGLIQITTPELRQAYKQGREDGKKEVWHLVIFLAMPAFFILALHLVGFWVK